ncbi:MAG: hypothetical protein M3380_12460 [Chloroflexota bacterium]|nr:hypothetical protein [Chloroflexota bacterium]
MADTDSILQLGIEAARAGDKAEARELFRLVTREDANNAQGWLWLAGVAEDRDEKRAALEQVVRLDPNNQLARKGLAALAGAQASAPTAPPPPAGQAGAAAGATAVIPPSTDAPGIPASTGAPDAPAPTGAPGVPASSGAPDVPPARSRVRRYDSPPAAATPPAGTPAGDTSWTAPTVDADDYDLQDYQQPAQPVPASRAAGTTVVVEDEEPRRRGRFAWLPVLLGLSALLLAGLFLWQNFLNRPGEVADDSATGLLGAATTAAGANDPAYPAGEALVSTVTAGPEDQAYPGPGALATTLPLTGTEATTAAEATPAPAEQTTAPPTVEQATAPPAAEQTQAPAPEQTVATVAAEQALTPAQAEQTTAPPAEPTSAPTAEPTTIVVVPPGATVVPPGAETAAAPPAPTPPPPPPAASGNIAAANPATVPDGTVIQAGSWSFTSTRFKNVARNAYGGSRPIQGQYQIVVMQVANNGGQPSTIPDGFFVLKDAQGRVYDFNRAASVDYFKRYGGAGVAADVAADAQFPSSRQLSSVPLLFDVPPDATNLVLMSRENLNQGFLIRR